MSRLWRILPVLAAVLAIVSGCQGESRQSAEAATVIYRGNGGEPGSLDPMLAEDIHAFNILADLYEGLVTVSADGSLVPGVAESWSVSENGLTYTFTLSEDAFWSNGERVTADHFVNAYRRVTAPTSTSAYAFLLDPIREYTAVDDRTLEIQLTEPTPHLLALLAMPIAFPMPDAEIDSETFVSPENFTGNGAYLLAGREAGGAIRLGRNPNYPEAAVIDEIVYLPIADPLTELNLFRSGELDITQTIPTGRIEDLRQAMPDAVRLAPALALYYLAFDLTEPPLDNPTIRQALSMAIDRRQLVEIIGRGERPAFGIVPDGIAAYEGAEFQWRHLSDGERLSQARRLYEEAGYSETNPLTLEYIYDTGDIHEKVALVVAGMWHDELGVDVKLEKMEWQYFLDTRDRRSDWQVMRFAWFGDYNHASTFTNIFRSADEQNLARFSNARYDQLLTSASRERNSERQAELLAEAEALLLSENPVAPLYFFVSKHLVAPHVGGFEHNALDRHPSRFLYLEDND